jgi:hypothetical protein
MSAFAKDEARLGFYFCDPLGGSTSSILPDSGFARSARGVRLRPRPTDRIRLGRIRRVRTLTERPCRVSLTHSQWVELRRPIAIKLPSDFSSR